MIKRLFALFILATFSLSYYQNAFSQDEIELLEYSGYVNDFAGILDTKTESAISALAQEIEERTSAQIAVVTIDSVKPSTIEQYAVRLFEKWGIGQKGKDNGVLILTAINDRVVRIEVGYGLEGALPDAICNRIIYQIIIPEFKKSSFNKGLLLGTIAVAEDIAKEYNIKLDLNNISPYAGSVLDTAVKERLFWSLFLLFIVFFLLSYRLFFLPGHYTRSDGRRRGGYWHGSGFGGSSGGFGGGFGGFGGGLSGGGGATGRW